MPVRVRKEAQIAARAAEQNSTHEHARLTRLGHDTTHSAMAIDSDARDRALLASMEKIRSVIRERSAADVVEAAVSTTAELSEQPSGGRAAVALVLRENAGDPEILLIRRAERKGDPWSGHMAFPGGREDARDESLLETALRETREEL